MHAKGNGPSKVFSAFNILMIWGRGRGVSFSYFVILYKLARNLYFFLCTASACLVVYRRPGTWVHVLALAIIASCLQMVNYVHTGSA
jgi:hypothetical protein